MGYEETIPLGKNTDYQFSYDKTLLCPIPRSETRSELGLTAELPFSGIDRWTAYELSWLNDNGQPQVAIAEFDFPCEAANLVESKSFKLYLNSFNQTQLRDQQALIKVLKSDLSECSGADVGVRLYALHEYHRHSDAAYQLLDELEITCEHYLPEASLLLAQTETQQQQCYKSHLFRSLCPVTSQPDWASIYIECSGAKINSDSLLAYLASYRNHQGFHEQCVEMIFQDLQALAEFSELSVYARFLRRGGLDINPYRSLHSGDKMPPLVSDSRQ